jgi:hypothetical protein
VSKREQGLSLIVGHVTTYKSWGPPNKDVNDLLYHLLVSEYNFTLRLGQFSFVQHMYAYNKIYDSFKKKKKKKNL